jgi:hypothetical protein
MSILRDDRTLVHLLLWDICVFEYGAWCYLFDNVYLYSITEDPVSCWDCLSTGHNVHWMYKNLLENGRYRLTRGRYAR